MRQHHALRISSSIQRCFSSKTAPPTANENLLWGADTFNKRVDELKSCHGETPKSATNDAWYPRLAAPAGSPSNSKSFNEAIGRVLGVRRHGKKLAFVDIRNPNGEPLQVKCNKSEIANVNHSDWQKFYDTIQDGDIYFFRGHNVQMKDGKTGLNISEPPQLFAPSLHKRPEKVSDTNTTSRFPQLELDMNLERIKRLHTRHAIHRELRRFLEARDFIEVQTPILAADSGGAAARPFTTQATYVSNHPLKLRIAPELELKKLVAAGMDRVYEIGPCFRNEGLDATHNPEFTTCEFYQAYATLDCLIDLTVDLYNKLRAAVPAGFRHPGGRDKPQCDSELLKLDPLPLDNEGKPLRISFIPRLEAEIQKCGIQDFHFPNPITQSSGRHLLDLLPKLNIPKPHTPEQQTSRYILDLLASHLLEPLCEKGGFITDYPAILSPLAKSYTCPKTGHEITARAEFFIRGMELANMYEEENNPFAQARKFLTQALESNEADGAADAAAAQVASLSHQEVVRQLRPAQRYYVRVLEMGLPPTAGWGCGVDRLVMLLTGARRIGEVLPFGNLRNVIAMGT